MTRPRQHAKAAEFASLKARVETLAKLRRAAAILSNRGWTALGVDRTDPVTLGAVMDAAVNELLRAIEP